VAEEAGAAAASAAAAVSAAVEAEDSLVRREVKCLGKQYQSNYGERRCEG
jgi:hypothetical protein